MSQTNMEELSRDRIFDILSNPRRRYLIFYLRDNNGEFDLQELAAEVAAWENEVEVENLTRAQRKRVYVSLYQTHIPQLEEAGIIDYDKDEGTVKLTARATELAKFVGPDSGPLLTWPIYYVGLALLSTIVFLVISFDVSLFARISEATAAIGIILAFIMLAAVHYFYTEYVYPAQSFNRLRSL